MKPERQRIAIAEACGWKPKIARIYAGKPNVRVWEKSEGGFLKTISTPLSFPDYPNDLNAMHEAEKTLKANEIGKYVSRLWDAMYYKPEAVIGTIHATAAQRAEAFLRTINKWEDE